MYPSFILFFNLLLFTDCVSFLSCFLHEYQFLYYLYDRHWTEDDEGWRDILDDFAVSFKVTRHLLLESLTFYLLDDHTEQALKVSYIFLNHVDVSFKRRKKSVICRDNVP